MSEENKKMTESDKMWKMVTNAKLNLFGLPDQKATDYLDRVVITDNELYLKLKPQKKNATAVISALEESLGKDFVVEQNSVYMIIKRA